MSCQQVGSDRDGRAGHELADGEGGDVRMLLEGADEIALGPFFLDASILSDTLGSQVFTLRLQLVVISKKNTLFSFILRIIYLFCPCGCSLCPCGCSLYTSNLKHFPLPNAPALSPDKQAAKAQC